MRWFRCHAEKPGSVSPRIYGDWTRTRSTFQRWKASTGWSTREPRRRRCSGGTPSRAAARGTQRWGGAAQMSTTVETFADSDGLVVAAGERLIGAIDAA